MHMAIRAWEGLNDPGKRPLRIPGVHHKDDVVVLQIFLFLLTIFLSSVTGEETPCSTFSKHWQPVFVCRAICALGYKQCPWLPAEPIATPACPTKKWLGISTDSSFGSSLQ
jgi:hypothetical protein